jgi:hypothetical protein
MLLHLAVPEDPQSCRFLMARILCGTSFLLQGHRGRIRQRHKVKWKTRGQHHVNTMKQKLRVHLFAFALASLKVGCRVESWFRSALVPGGHHFLIATGMGVVV